MREYSLRNKKAWEYNAYEFWVRESGTPQERGRKIKSDPEGALKRYARYFDSYQSVKVANICGSCGKKAVPLAVLGADVTIFDISEDNKKYAMELAAAAGTSICYEVGDVLDIDLTRFESWFDVVFMEGGVLHYFHDIHEFMGVMHSLLKEGGKLICSDFHPFTKILDVLEFGQNGRDYFSAEVFEGEMAHARFFDDAVRAGMPKCSYRKYTVSEIVNGVVGNGFCVERFDEHPAWTDPTVPGEFTLIARK